MPIVISLNGHTEPVASLSLSNRFLASGGGDDRIYFWSVSQSRSPVLYLPETGACSALKFSKEKPDLLYSTHGRRIISWDTRCLQYPLSDWNVNDSDINSIDLVENEGRLAAADKSGAVKVIATDSGCVVRTLNKHEGVCSSVKFRPNRTCQLVSGGLDCRLVVSDWKCSGLGVTIFQLDEIIDSRGVLPNNNLHDYFTSSELDTSTDSDAEVDSDESVDEDSADDVADLETYGEEEELPQTNSLASRNVPRVPQYITTSVSGDGQRLRESRDLYNQSTSTLAVEFGLPHGNRRLGENNSAPSVEPLPSLPVLLESSWIDDPLISPPMVRVLTCTNSGSVVAAGLDSTSIELFSSTGRRLTHVQPLHGHRSGVTALHFIQESYLVSGANDETLSVWVLSPDVRRSEIKHVGKVCAIEGNDLNQVFVANDSPIIQVFDLCRL